MLGSQAQTSHAEDDNLLTTLAEHSTRLGFDIVEISGFLDSLDAESRSQVLAIGNARQASDQIVDACARVRERADEVVEASESGLQLVLGSVDDLRSSGARAKSVAEWVQRLEMRMAEVAEVLSEVQDNNRNIGQIAKQVNILAINAKIEATRAGDAGRGFAIVADAINELSRKTAQAGEKIGAATETLTGAVAKLRTESETVSTEAGRVLKESEGTDEALSKIADEVKRSAGAAGGIAEEVVQMDQALGTFGGTFAGLEGQVRRVTEDVTTVRGRVESLVDLSESIVQCSVEAGGAASDGAFIEKVQDLAAQISAAFEAGVASGEISEADLFTRRYQTIPGSDPEQVMAPFTRFTDRVLPPIQETALEFAPSVVFCAAVDTNGYLPTHNKKFSRPQGNDPVWNAANCRNRRIFDDRVGLKAGRNQQSFLMQIYRRDMGGGNFVLMKDLSAPIFVRGRHWGGVRFAFKV